MISDKNLIKYAYMLFLDREPSETEVSGQVRRRFDSVKTLRSEFLVSPEFCRSNTAYTSALAARDYAQDRPPVEVDVSLEVMKRLRDHVEAQWKTLGHDSPYWGVITHDRYLKKDIERGDIEDFYKSGEQSASLIDVFARRAGVDVASPVCFELGCGAGRVTQHLAGRFRRVIGADIADSYVKLCDARMKEIGKTNVDVVHLKQFTDIPATFDFFFSIIVLQHNPPPVQKALLDTIFKRLKSGGFGLFQTPDTFLDDEGKRYGFSSAEFLRKDRIVMDMHCLPQKHIYELLERHGMTLLEAAPDPWIGQVGSMTYFVRKR